MTFLSYVRSRMFKQKEICHKQSTTSLKRCLNTFQLTFVGVGSMVGSGIYILIGVATKEQAGPAVIISFILAAISSLFTSLCFAEFGSSIPKSGNPYLYVYSVFGEFAGFLTGWSFAIGYLMSGALSARAWSGYLDSLLGNILRNYTIKIAGTWTIGDPITEHPDFVAAAVLIIFTLIALTGIQCSASLTNILAIMNCTVLLVFSIVGVVFGSRDNWVNSERGGFFPFGAVGVMQGTAASFFAFFGYENVCIAAEESRNYSKSVPRALIASLLIAASLYIGTAISFTLLVPYYSVDIHAPIAAALAFVNVPWLRYMMYIGPMCGFSTILLLNGYVFSRLMLSLAEEGLMWRGFATVNRRTKVPVVSLLICCVVEALCALFFQLEHLFKFYVIVCIVSFTTISFGVLRLRYGDRRAAGELRGSSNTPGCSSDGGGHRQGTAEGFGEIDDLGFEAVETKMLKNTACCGNYARLVNLVTSISMNVYLLIISACCMSLALTVTQTSSVSAIIAALSICAPVVCFCTYEISQFEPKPQSYATFKVPFVPVFPVVAGIINVFFLVTTFDVISLVGYVIVVVMGIAVYLTMCFMDMRRGVSHAHAHVSYSLLRDDLPQLNEDL